MESVVTAPTSPRVSPAERAEMFPIMASMKYEFEERVKQLRAGGCVAFVVAVPWALLVPHEEQARSNHGGQSLKRLAERGGLSACEALAVLEDRRWRRMPSAEANGRLLASITADFTMNGRKPDDGQS